MILFYDNSMHYEDSIICMIVLYDTSDEDLELSGAPHPYTYNTRKKIPRNLKKIWDFGISNVGSRCTSVQNLVKKIPGNVFAAKKTKNFYV